MGIEISQTFRGLFLNAKKENYEGLKSSSYHDGINLSLFAYISIVKE